MHINQDFTWDRSQFLGGSDIGAILGFSKYRTPVQVWMEKKGKTKPFIDTLATRFGHFNEAFVANEYEKATGFSVATHPNIITHHQYPYFGAHIDRLVYSPAENEAVLKEISASSVLKNALGVLECKTANPFSKNEWGEPGTDQIPLPYLCQCLWYLSITQLPKADLAVLFGNTEFAIYTVTPDPELEALILEKAQHFWQEYVLKDIAPPTQTENDCAILFSESTPQLCKEASAEMIEYVHKLSTVNLQIKEYETQASSLKQSIMNYLEDADTLTHGDQVLATWKSTNAAKRFDAKGFAAAHPELYAQYLKQGEVSRRFVLKSGGAHD